MRYKSSLFGNLLPTMNCLSPQGLTPYDVKYYMVIIAKDSESLIHLFSAFDLRLDDLLKIFYPARKEILSDVQKK